MYGVDWDGPLPTDENIVEVPDTPCPLSHESYAVLTNEVNPLDETTVHGMDLYERTLAFVTRTIGNCVYICILLNIYTGCMNICLMLVLKGQKRIVS